MPSRRSYLALGSGLLASALAGCVGDEPTAESGATLETLSVAGSPGGEVPVRPAGTVALLDFFATWCAPCKPQMAELRAVREQFDDLHLLSITTEQDREAVADFWREYDGTWPVALDADLAVSERYGATQVPTLLVVGPDGEEVWRHVGLASAEKIVEKVEEATR